MNLTSPTLKLELLLHPRQVLNLDHRQHRMAIECKNGLIWVTRSGEHRDLILRAGKRWIVDTKGSVILEAIDEACVDIEETE